MKNSLPGVNRASFGRFSGTEMDNRGHSPVEQDEELLEGCVSRDGGRPSPVLPWGATVVPKHGREVDEGDKRIYCISK